MKLQTLIEKFLLSYEGVYSPTTVQWYKDYLKPLNALADEEIADLTVDDLRVLYVQLARKKKTYTDHPHPGRKPKNKGYSKYTLHSFARSWKRLFNWAVEEGHLIVSPSRRLQLPHLPDPTPKRLSRDDLLKLINESKCSKNPERDEAILRFLADTSARVGGMASLRLSDLNLGERWAIVREKGKGGNGKSRSVYINPATASSMDTWIKARPNTDDKRVFLLTEAGIYQAIDRLAKSIGIKSPHNPHAFRHGFAIGMLERGANLKQVSQLMGHANITVTAMYYGQFPTKYLREFHERYSWSPGEDENHVPEQKKDNIKTLTPIPEPEDEQPDPSETITIPQAVKVAKEHGYELTNSTIYYAARVHNIKASRKYGRDWVFTRGEFLHWLTGRYKPKT